MPADEASMQWLQRELRAYVDEHEAELEAVVAADGVDAAEAVLDLISWTHRSDDVVVIRDRTIFALKRVRARLPVDEASLDAAWPGEYLPPLPWTDEDEAEAEARGAEARRLRDYVDSLDQDEVERAFEAAGGVMPVVMATGRWARADPAGDTFERNRFAIDQVLAGHPIDSDSLDAAWAARPQRS